MCVGLGEPITANLSQWQEWQRLCWTAIGRAMGHYLHGCADLAMARTPQQALAALHRMQRGFVRHSADAVAAATTLWREQNLVPPVPEDERARKRARPAAKS